MEDSSRSGKGLSMLRSRRKWRFTIFPKLFLALMAVFVPLYGGAMYMNQLGESKLEAELSKALQSKIDFYVNSLEVESQHMITMLQEFNNDKDIQHLTYLSQTMSLFEFTETIRRVQSKLEQLKRSSIYAKGVYAHILTLNRTMSSESSIEASLSAEFEAVRSLVRSNGSGVLVWNGRAFFAITYPGVPDVNVQPGFILAIELNLNAMRNALASFYESANAGAVLMNVTHDIDLVSGGGETIVPELREFVVALDEEIDRGGLKRSKFGGQSYVAAYQYVDPIDMYAIAFQPTEEMRGPIGAYRELLVWFSVIAVIIVILYSYWIYRLIHKPLQNLVRAFRRAEQGQLSPTLLPKQDDEFLYLFRRFNMMIANLDVLVHQVYEQKLRAQTSELKQLQAQINPHFLYNTYFILYRLAKAEDNESIAQFSQYLGEYFQYITRSGMENVPLELEFHHAATYAEIQNIRFKNRIRVEFCELREPYKTALVPQLILQPLLENSYMHGLEERRKPGLIKVGVDTDGEDLRITVEDNGDKLTDERLSALQASLLMQGEEHEYTGLLNVNRRLQLRFGEGCGVRVERGELGGLSVALRLRVKMREEIDDRGEDGNDHVSITHRG